MIRALRRLVLIPRALRVSRERQFQDLDAFLNDIRENRKDRRGRPYADEVE